MQAARRQPGRPAITEPSGLEDMIQAMERETGYGPLLMTEAAAEAIGVARLTLVRWRTKGRLDPYAELIRGRQKIPVYGPTEIAKGQLMRGTIPPGPEPGSKRPSKTPPTKKPQTNRAQARKLLAKRETRRSE